MTDERSSTDSNNFQDEAHWQHHSEHNKVAHDQSDQDAYNKRCHGSRYLYSTFGAGGYCDIIPVNPKEKVVVYYLGLGNGVRVSAPVGAVLKAYNSGGGTEYASSGQSSGNNPKDGPLDTPERQHATTAKMTTSSPEPPRPKALRTSKPADEITLYKKVMPPPMKYRESVLLLHYDKNCRYLRKAETSEHKFTMRTVQSNWLCTVCMKGSPLENWC